MSKPIQARHLDALDSLDRATVAMTTRRMGLELGRSVDNTRLILDRLVGVQLADKVRARPCLYYITLSGQALLATLPAGMFPPRWPA